MALTVQELVQDPHCQQRWMNSPPGSAAISSSMRSL
jgi:hypothetical protein